MLKTFALNSHGRHDEGVANEVGGVTDLLARSKTKAKQHLNIFPYMSSFFLISVDIFSPVQVRLLALDVSSSDRIKTKPTVERPAVLVRPRLDGRKCNARLNLSREAEELVGTLSLRHLSQNLKEPH